MVAYKQKRGFANRVFTERTVLSLVNSKLGHVVTLPGLTIDTISKWEQGLSTQRPSVQAVLVSDRLREISLRCQLDSDCSRDVFSDEELVSAGSVDEAINRLTIVLNELSL